MKFFRFALKKIKLFVLFWSRIVFVKNNFNVNFFTKLRANFFGGFLADQYVLFDFKHNNKKDFLSEFDWYKSRYINEPFDFAFNNKVICSEILKQYINVPTNFFIKNKGLLYDFSHGLKNNEDVFHCLKLQKNLILKPFALGKGNGVHLLSYTDSSLKPSISIDGKTTDKGSLFNFLDQRDDFIISQFINQHSYAVQLYDKTANTIRLITLRDIHTHKMKIYFAVQRIGTSRTIPVDNGSKGGLVCNIDINTGTLSPARCLHDTSVYHTHPDSGNPIEGVVIPNWTDLKKRILSVADQLPFMDFIAWDILISSDASPCVIEANSSSGVNILQLWGGLRNKELGHFFRHYGVIKD